MILYNPTVSGSLLVTGSLTTTGTITSQTLVVQTITSSIEFNTGSTRNGSLAANTHEFTGSVSVSGSITVGSSITATSLPSVFKEGYIIQASTTSGGGSQPAYTYYTAVGSKRWSHFLNVGDDKFHIANASNSEVFTINQSGSVGIGTTSPSQLFEVVGGEIKAGRVDSSNEGGQVSFGRASDNATAWYIDAYGNTSTPSLRFVDVSNSAVRLTINSSGVLELTSGQLKFPSSQNASADANTLDDYEEGTWTPVIRGANTAGTYQLSSASHYIKIGNQVTATSRITMAGTITGGGAGYLQITGLPFSKGNNIYAVGSCDVIGLDTTGNYLTVQFVTLSSTSVLFISEINDNASAVDLPISSLSANDAIGISITYFV
jgi:hypothetical protein